MSQRQGLLLLLTCLALPGSHPARGEPPVPAGKQKAPDAAQIDRLIKQLGSDDFSEREAASRALEAIGEPALGALRKAAAKSDDAEICRRAGDVVKAVETRLRGELRCFEGHEDSVLCVAFSPDGKRALSGGADNMVRLWDAETGKELRRFEGHTDWVEGVAFSPDGKRALSGSRDATVRLWDVGTGKELRRFEGHENDVFSVAFSPDGKRALSGGDATVRLWEVETGKELRCFKGHTDDVRGVAFSPDGKQALSGSYDETVRLWQLPADAGSPPSPATGAAGPKGK